MNCDANKEAVNMVNKFCHYNHHNYLNVYLFIKNGDTPKDLANGKCAGLIEGLLDRGNSDEGKC